MELRQLKYFLEVADARSFVGAANNLFVSRQAVSKAVGQLEGELGVELFVRDPSGAFLTPAGLIFYDRIRSSVMELERVCNLSTKVPAAEQTAFQEIHPSCLTRFYGNQPYGYGWRYNDNGYTFFWYYKEVIREVFNYDLVDKLIGNA